MMWKIGFALMLVLIISGCGTIENEETQTPAAVSFSDSSKLELISLDGISVFGDKVSNDLYTEIIVKNDMNEKKISWSNVTNETYYPELMIDDINNDHKEELIIILTKAYGTGFNQQEVHILNKDNLSEFAIEDAEKYVKNNKKSSIDHVDGKVKVTLNIGEESFEKSYDESMVEQWNEEIGFGNIINYEVIDHKLIATLAGSISPVEYALSVKLTYSDELKIQSVMIEGQ